MSVVCLSRIDVDEGEKNEEMDEVGIRGEQHAFMCQQ